MTFTTTEPFHFRAGTRPLLVSIPHAGEHLPPALAARLSEEARSIPDTDWHLERLYGFAEKLGASVLVATHSRYVIDLNRPLDGSSLYPGRSVTALCPVDTFDGNPLYRDAAAGPDEAEIAVRRDAVWRPYHTKLSEEIGRLKAAHGSVVLWDAHSIRSVLPRFFEGKLPDLNLGTADGVSCDPCLADELLTIVRQDPAYTGILNGRFKGGHITRHFGDPRAGVHAVQLELTQCSYMQEEPPFDYLPECAQRVQPTLRRLLEAALAFAEARGRG